MTPLELGLTVALAAVAGLLVGVVIGRANERSEWVTRAMPKSMTPHHCDGEFYYVVPEWVAAQYTRKPLATPKGGSGTGPPQGRPVVGPKGGTGTPPKGTG